MAGTERIKEVDDPLAQCSGPEASECSKALLGGKANAIAAVKDVETFAKAASGRFLARTLCHPL